jgi:hypothetical protein
MQVAISSADSPAARSDPEWDEAFLRVQSYVRAHGLESPVLLSQATDSIIRDAKERGHAGAGGHPVSLAMEVTHARIGEWFAQACKDVDWTNERARSQGRLALVIADLPGRWADHFLSSDAPPPGLAEAIGSRQILPAPQLRVVGMAPEPLEFGVLDPGDPRLPSRRIWIPAKAVVSWLLIFGFFGVAWAATH